MNTKQEEKQNIIEYLQSKKTDIYRIVDRYIAELGNPEKIERASIRQVATAFGFLVDKCIQVENTNKNSCDKLDKLIEAIKNS